MGTEYLLCKIKNGQAYNLGKPACRPPLSWSWKITKTYLEKLKYFQPSEYAMWKIGNDGANIEPFKIKERWNHNDLAEIIQQACLNEDDLDYCINVTKASYQGLIRAKNHTG